jgi:hypothetical protein
VDGRVIPEKLWARDDVQRAFGGAIPCSGISPRVMVILAAIRCGKSMMSAAKAVVASQTVDVSRLSPGDEVRIPILAPHKDAARQTYAHLVASLHSSPFLKRLLFGDPTGESVWIRHPSGRPIEITVTALSKYGITLTSRWIATCIFDEAPRCVGIEDGKKNLDEALRAVSLRILPGGQIMLIGSPYAAYGPVYDLVQERFGRPGKDCCVVRADGPSLNPWIWTPEACETARMNNPHEYRTDVLAEFDDPEDSLLPANRVDRAMRKAPEVRPPEDGVYYVAAMDPGARASAWTFVILARVKSPDGSSRAYYSVALAKQWRATRKSDKDDTGHGIDPKQTLIEIKELCDRYNIGEVHTDQFSADSLSSIAEDRGLSLLVHNIDGDIKWAMASTIRTTLDEGVLELPPVSSKDGKALREDLVRVKKRLVNSSMKPQIHLPTSGDGRHCDFFTALGLVLLNPPEAPIQGGRVPDVDPDWYGMNDSQDEWERAVSDLTA